MSLDITNCEWIDLNPSNSPGARTQFATWWDTNRDSWVIYGGGSGSGPVGDMWEYAAGDVEDWQLIGDAAPGPRYNMTYAFGGPEGEKVAMIVGGITPASFDADEGSGFTIGADCQETWIYDGTTWTQLFPATVPYKQVYGQGTYPSQAGLVWSDHYNMWIYTVAGLVAHPNLQVQTYGYYEGDWHMLHDGAFSVDYWHSIGVDYPAECSNHANLAFGDYVYVADGRFALSNTVTTGYPMRVQRWHGDHWDVPENDDGLGSALSPAPRHREGYSWVYDGQYGLLFSGDTTSTGDIGLVSDQQTWAFNGTEWVRFYPDGSLPPPRYETNMVWDEERNRALMYGGTSIPDLDPLGDTWELISVATPVVPPNLHLAPFRVPINNQGVPRTP